MSTEKALKTDKKESKLFVSPKKKKINQINDWFGGEIKKDLEIDSVRKELRKNEDILTDKINSLITNWKLLETELNNKIKELESNLSGNKGLRYQHLSTWSQLPLSTFNNMIQGKQVDYLVSPRVTISPIKETPTGKFVRPKRPTSDDVAPMDRNIQTLRNHYGIKKRPDGETESDNIFNSMIVKKNFFFFYIFQLLFFFYYFSFFFHFFFIFFYFFIFFFK